MINENEAVQRLCLHEGIRLQPYRCPAGYLTIGVGRNLETNPLTAEEKKVCGDWQHGITKNAAFFLLRNDIKRVEAECAERIPFWKQLDDERQYALVDMAFNLGVSGLLKFKKCWVGLASAIIRRRQLSVWLQNMPETPAKGRCELHV